MRTREACVTVPKLKECIHLGDLFCERQANQVGGKWENRIVCVLFKLIGKLSGGGKRLLCFMECVNSQWTICVVVGLKCRWFVDELC